MIGIIKVGATEDGELPADLPTVVIDLGSNHSTRDEGAHAYNTNLALVRSPLAKADTPGQDITTDGFTIRPRTEALYAKSDKHHGCHYKTTVAHGYEYHGPISVHTGDIANLAAPVWLALTECGPAIEFHLNFDLADKTRARDSLLSKAMANAKGRAAVFVEASGGQPDAPRFQPSPIELFCRGDTEWQLLDAEE